MPVACSAIGYATGMATCSNCMRDESACDGCMADPTVTDCRSFAQSNDQIFVAEVSGSRVAVATSHDAVSIYGADLAPVMTVAQPEDIATLIAVPDGWLTFPPLRAVSSDGVLGGTHPGPDSTLFPAGTYGPGGHALFAWNVMKLDDTHHPYAELDAMVVDATGAVVTAPFMLQPSSVNVFDPIVTTDGTSFFVGTLDQVIRVGPTGTILGTTTGFPGHDPNPIAVTYFAGFANGTGWFVGLGALRTYWIQRFDANGAKVGAATMVEKPDALSFISGFSVDGDHLVALGWTDRMQQMTADVSSIQISAAGVVSTPIALGIGSLDYRGKAERLGPDLLAGWLAGNHVQLARLAP